MSLPQWAINAGANPELWDNGKGSLVRHITDRACWMYVDGDYANCRVPVSLAPAIIQLIEAHYPKPPSEEEAKQLIADLLNTLGPGGLRHYIGSITGLGTAPTARTVLECAVRAYKAENGLDGAHDEPLARAEKWLERTKIHASDSPAEVLGLIDAAELQSKASKERSPFNVDNVYQWTGPIKPPTDDSQEAVTAGLYPQHTCLRGEDGECAPVYAGLGIRCVTCKRYWHSGDEGAREIEQFMIRQRALEVSE